MFSAIRVRNVHGGFPGKNLDHSKIHDVRPKNGHFSTLSGFWRKYSPMMLTFDGLKWKFRLFLKSPRKPHVQKISVSFFRIFSVRRVGRFEWSIQLLAIFLSLVHRINLILHILTILNGVNNLVMIWLMLDHSKSRKIHFWMIQRDKNWVFGHFLDLGLLDWLDIA